MNGERAVPVDCDMAVGRHSLLTRRRRGGDEMWLLRGGQNLQAQPDSAHQ